jgi:hypothetical protein
MRSALLPALGIVGYPLILLGGISIFGLSSLAALEMVSANAGRFTTPASGQPDFNLPPVEQIGTLAPVRAEPKAAPVEAAAPESSIVAVAPPQHQVAVSLSAPEGTPSTVDVPAQGQGRIGSQAVNVRASPSKTGVVLGVLNAGSPVRVGEDVGGWIHVWFEGGDGWVYKTYLAG